MVAISGPVAGTLGRVASKQREYDLARTVLLIAMAVPFLVGWLAGKVVTLVWLVLSWFWAATVVGWQTARGAEFEVSRK